MADINGRSFIATLQSRAGDKVYPVGYLRDASIEGSGWLIQRSGPQTAQRKATLRFDFLEHAGNRLHYKISCTQDPLFDGAKLGVSRNGYLGFYEVAQVQPFWKLELNTYDPGPDLFEFILRDDRGYRVGCVVEAKGGFWTGIGNSGPASQRIRFLNVEEGEIVYFQAKILRYL